MFTSVLADECMAAWFVASTELVTREVSSEAAVNVSAVAFVES